MSDAVAAARGEVARERLLAGLERALEGKGYASVTVGDIVAAAGTSKRTYYEHYATKAECLIDHYERFSDQVIARIAEAALAQPTPMEATREGIRVFFRATAEKPAVARAHLFEIPTLGEAGASSRSGVKRRYAAAIRAVVEREAEDGTRVVLGEHHATGLVGAFYELALTAAEESRVHELEDVVDDAASFFRSVVKGLPQA